MSGRRAVSFFGPGESEFGAGATGAAAGAIAGIDSGDRLGGETGVAGGCGKIGGVVGSLAAGFGTGDCSAGLGGGTLVEGGRIGSWIRTVSRDLAFVLGDFAAG